MNRFPEIKYFLICLIAAVFLNCSISFCGAIIIKREDGELELIEEQSRAEEISKDMREQLELENIDGKEDIELKLEKELGKYDPKKAEEALKEYMAKQLGVTEKDIADYEGAEIFVKLKPGSTLEDILALNDKHQVFSITAMFSENLSPEEKLEDLMARLLRLNRERQPWQWQLDKRSEAYIEYSKRLREDKIALMKEIKAQKEIAAEFRKKPGHGPPAPRTRNLYLLKANRGANMFFMLQDYMSNPHVEYVEPRYGSKEEEK